MYKGQVPGRTLLLTDKSIEHELLNCCEQMSFHAKEKEQIIVCDPILRRVGVKASNNVYQLIKYCPWCSKELPKELGEEFDKIIFDELKLEGYNDLRVPEEFKTDEWWKKRGL